MIHSSTLVFTWKYLLVEALKEDFPFPGDGAAIPGVHPHPLHVEEEEGPRQRGHPLPDVPRRPARLGFPRTSVPDTLSLRHGVWQQRTIDKNAHKMAENLRSLWIFLQSEIFKC